MTSITALRLEVARRAQTILGMPVIAGKLEGPVEKHDVACVFPVAVEEGAESVLEERIMLRLRVFLRFSPRTDPERAIDPEPLEEIAERLQAGLADLEQEPGDAWFLRVVGIDFDLDRRSLEARIEAQAWNPFTT